MWLVVNRVPQAAHVAVVDGGFVGPVPVGSPLPDSAYRSSIRLSAREMTAWNVHFGVDLTHTGKGAPWPGSYSLVQPRGVGLVHLSVTLAGPNGVSVATHGCAVPRTLLPGETVHIDCNVRLAPADTARVEKVAGPFVLRVGLDQLGVTSFAARGDAIATLPVTLRK